MNWTTILQMAWDVVNSPAGITVMAGGLIWLLNRLYTAKPAWQAFEGTIIAAVKWAEKEIPDDASNKAVKRLDAALAYVLKVYEDARGTADARTRQEMREGIQIVHAELEAAGNLAAKADLNQSVAPGVVRTGAAG